MTHLNPNLDQDSFRGRNDDGSETAATWKATVNTNWTQNVDENFRVRFLVQEDAGGTESNVNLRLQYNLNVAGWNNVSDLSSVVRAFASANFAEGDNTTQQIGAGTFITPNSGMDEVDGVAGQANDIDFAGNDEVEVEYCVQIIGADVADADSLQLRVVRDGGTLETWTNTPGLTVSKSAGNTNVDATVVNMTLTEQVADVNAETDIAASVSSLTLTTFAADVNAETDVVAGVDSLTLTEQTATVELTQDVNVSATTDALTLSTFSADVNAETDIAANTGTLTVSTFAAGVSLGVEVLANTDALTLTENAATVNAETNVSAGTDALTLSTFAATIETTSDTNVNATTATLTLTENQADVNAEIAVAASVDALILTTNTASINAETLIEAALASLTLSSFSASVNAETNIDAATVTLTLTEHAATAGLDGSGFSFSYFFARGAAGKWHTSSEK